MMNISATRHFLIGTAAIGTSVLATVSVLPGSGFVLAAVSFLLAATLNVVLFAAFYRKKDERQGIYFFRR